MRSRMLVVALGLAAALNTVLFVSACAEKPAATVKEVNKLDATSGDAPNPIEDPRFKEFFDRVSDYMKIHQASEAKVPNLKKTDDPKEVSGREKALAEAIRVARAGARQGEVFSSSAAKEIADVVVEDFNGRAPKDQQAILSEVPMKTPPSINTDYPTAMPLATVPAGLLQKLPTLPEELEYRFLGRHLILRDTKANLIVDFIPDVVPAAPAKTTTAGREAHP
jgi:hypothetical protein